MHEIPATSSTSSLIELPPVAPSSVYTMYRSSDGYARNQSGIVMKVNGRAKIAILTGDYHYGQLLKGVMDPHESRLKPYELVVPHHGGSAGSWEKKITTGLKAIDFSGGVLSTSSKRCKNVPREDVHHFFVKKLGFACFCSLCKPSVTGYDVSLDGLSVWGRIT
ncbi:hypothetical protein [Salisediminibacterium selenitireducens]|uniref:Metallo-beta-lactamase domain-containing protein n=1 Tax=Bacillus selenitireducens (strain ATCC 700615 / DSM 15326 / MLS10) TaxID=439292 RepID=D6XZG7_BACIE|nr:hypothetical protein [Salisediminibacterium selenitireducens]ADH98341.1 hypothetical protein Bsel_0812 [[Bacillus] selenitireducens MLS10]